MKSVKTLTYESLQAEYAFQIVSEQLNQRNTLLSRSISELEKETAHLPMASRLMVLRYHLRHSLRQLSREARQTPPLHSEAELLHHQWQHVHQLFFLLRQIDAELQKAKADSQPLHQWFDGLRPRIYKSSLVHLN